MVCLKQHGEDSNRAMSTPFGSRSHQGLVSRSHQDGAFVTKLIDLLRSAGIPSGSRMRPRVR